MHDDKECLREEWTTFNVQKERKDSKNETDNLGFLNEDLSKDSEADFA